MDREGILLDSGLQFFGTVSASISHEIKNSLATMREQAGLMEDLLTMAERGMQINLERLRDLATRINRQTERADEIVKNLNRFAHSVDEPSVAIGLADLARLVCALVHRSASQKGMEVAVREPAPSITVETHPFFLAHLLWQCVQFAASRQEGRGAVEIEVGEGGDQACLVVRSSGTLSDRPPPLFPDSTETALLDRVGAAVTVADNGRELTVQLPKHTG